MVQIIRSVSSISASYDAIFCDLWGCLHNGVAPFPEAVEALQRFRAEGGKVLFLTNAPRPNNVVQKSLDRLGVPHDAYDAIVSSGDATQVAMFGGAIGQNAWHLGPDKDFGLFSDAPGDAEIASTIQRVDLESADVIICTGLFDEFSETAEDYRERLNAARARELPMLCANPDLAVVLGEKELPCAGALAALYEEIGGEVRYFGKPHAPIYDLARQRLAQISGNGNNRILAIGDGVHTDVAGANLVGIDVLFVTSGIAAGQFGPDVDAPSPALLEAWLRKQEQIVNFAIGRLR
ncbi:MAG TPA: TIGR01459 family HAD-type hydrolase [Rhodobacterales bacterium]|nr:TIGR01459 family HAD-type hydrolase [Rhodobacterales bacterium]